jgi:hypothetical protein
MKTPFGFYKTPFGTALHLRYKDKDSALMIGECLERSTLYLGKNDCWHIEGLIKPGYEQLTRKAILLNKSRALSKQQQEILTQIHAIDQAIDLGY